MIQNHSVQSVATQRFALIDDSTPSLRALTVPALLVIALLAGCASSSGSTPAATPSMGEKAMSTAGAMKDKAMAAMGMGAKEQPMGNMGAMDQTGLPDAVRVPAGNMVAMETVGKGTIDYECKAKPDMPGELAWVFAGPKADLMDRTGKKVGRYFGPPATWESADGSAVTGKQLAVAPAGAGNIPFQLVQAAPATGMGAMSGVTYIQRTNLMGGAAPATGCMASTKGQRTTVNYQADYIFWKKAGM